MTDGLVQRVNATKSRDSELTEEKAEVIKNKDEGDEDFDKYKSKRIKFTLMEEIMLLSLKDDNGDISLFNDILSLTLRACILIELGLRGKIELEPFGARKRSFDRRNIIVTNTSLTGDHLLDEALKLISESPESDTIPGWISLLSGETWNPFRLKFQLRNVRGRLSKGLVEKGVCTTSKQSYIVFDMTTHPMVDLTARKNLIKYMQNLLLKDWRNIEAFHPRDIALLCLAHVTDVVDQVLTTLPDSDYEMAWSRMKQLIGLDPDQQISKINQIVESSEEHLNLMAKQIVFACLASLYDS